MTSKGELMELGCTTGYFRPTVRATYSIRMSSIKMEKAEFLLLHNISPFLASLMTYATAINLIPPLASTPLQASNMPHTSNIFIFNLKITIHSPKY